MTSPIERVPIDCVACSRSYVTPYRPSFKLELDPEFTDDHIEGMTSATCPACCYCVALGGLVVRTDGVWQVRRAV